MENEPLPEKQKITADDLKFMRSAVEKSYRRVKPETHDAVMWGLIAMTIYISTHFFIKYGLQNWVTLLYLSLIGLGFIGSGITGFFWLRRQRKKGFVPRLPLELGAIILIILVHIIIWERLGLFKNLFCGAGFIYAMGAGMAMGIYGILYSKAGFLGAGLIFVGMLVAFFANQTYPLIILGLSIGAGVIITAIIADRSYRKWEIENAQA